MYRNGLKVFGGEIWRGASLLSVVLGSLLTVVAFVAIPASAQSGNPSASAKGFDDGLGQLGGDVTGTAFGCIANVVGGQTVTEAASIDKLATALVQYPGCTTFVLTGHFAGTTPVVINRSVTIAAEAADGSHIRDSPGRDDAESFAPAGPMPVLWGSTLRLEARDIEIRGLYFRNQTATAIRVGRSANILGPAVRADGAKIEFNRFTDSFKQGKFAGAVIQVEAIDGNVTPPVSNEAIEIRHNQITDFGRNAVVYRGDEADVVDVPSQFFHGIRIGRSRLRSDRSTDPYTFNPTRQEATSPAGEVASEPTRVIVESNIIKTDTTWGSGYHSAVQTHDPAMIRGNCIVGTDIGIEIKSDESVVTGNKLVRILRKNRDGSGAALYQRDGDNNVYSDNLVVQSSLGFEAYSGVGNAFVGNTVLGSRVGIGRIHGAYHSGSRPEGDAPLELGREEPDLLTGQTSYRFAFEDSLIAHNTFINNNGGIHWHLPESGRWELPNQIYLVRNTFDRGRKNTHEKHTVLDLGDDPPNNVASLEARLRMSNFAKDNMLVDAFTWARGSSDPTSRKIGKPTSIPSKWSNYLTSSRIGADAEIDPRLSFCA